MYKMIRFMNMGEFNGFMCQETDEGKYRNPHVDFIPHSWHVVHEELFVLFLLVPTRERNNR